MHAKSCLTLSNWKQWLLISGSAFDKFDAFIDTCALTGTWFNQWWMTLTSRAFGRPVPGWRTCPWFWVCFRLLSSCSHNWFSCSRSSSSSCSGTCSPCSSSPTTISSHTDASYTPRFQSVARSSFPQLHPDPTLWDILQQTDALITRLNILYLYCIPGCGTITILHWRSLSSVSKALRMARRISLSRTKTFRFSLTQWLRPRLSICTHLHQSLIPIFSD